MASHLMNYLLGVYPSGYAMITTFGKEHSELLTVKKARRYIDNAPAHPDKMKFLVKRLNRWYVVIPAFVEYMEANESDQAA